MSQAAEIFDLAVAARTYFSPFSTIAGLDLLLPGIAVSMRRLHDLDRTGWWLLPVFTGIGGILMLIWDCMKGTCGPNCFGRDPLAGQV